MSLHTRLRGRAGRQVPLRWQEVPARRLARHPRGIDELLDGTCDGMTVRGVLTQREIERGLRGLDGVERIPVPFGWLLGMPLGMIGPERPDRTPYYDDTERARGRFAEAFGFDLHERLAEVLAPMSGGRPLVAPADGPRRYNPGHLRWFEPDRGGLPAHAGNEFREHMEHGAMLHLLTTTRVANHLSYFVVLQRPDRGGALSVYDLVWKELSSCEAPWLNGERDDRWFEQQPCMKVDAAPGDLVIFGGGWRWHRVDPLHGGRDRITYGGFCGPSLDGSEIHFWS